ncbi:MAG: hypothetical protein OEZ39_20065 [Gammaproteobacteria bacterium]|nr:hypothetical protein [Gammaproteobacteria bacterium]MDH5654165.1 hypothetical protein [Gammaproteobacteria bacterium]
MSLSWIKSRNRQHNGSNSWLFLRKLSPSKLTTALQQNLQQLSKHRQDRLAIILELNNLYAVHTVGDGKHRHVDWSIIHPLSTPLFNGVPGQADEAALDKFFAEVSSKIAGDYVSIQLSLPDPVVMTGFYQIDTIPAKPQQARELAGWRLLRQYHVHDQTLYCDCQTVGTKTQKQTLLAVAMDDNWLSLLQRTLQKNNLLVPVMEPAIHYKFNQLTESEKASAGVLVSLTKEYWTILIWDEAGDPRYIRSRRHQQIGTEVVLGFSEIAAEIIRTILVYSHEEANTEIGRVFISARQRERVMLGEYLQHKMEQQVERPEIEQETISTDVILEDLPAVCHAVMVSR